MVLPPKPPPISAGMARMSLCGMPVSSDVIARTMNWPWLDDQIVELQPGNIGRIEIQPDSGAGYAVRREDELILADALSRLPDDYRDVIVLRHIEGLPFEEVAARMERSAGAVRMLWLRALKKMREELESEN